MKKSILKLLGQMSVNRQSAMAPARKDNPATIQDGSENGVRRHLVQVLVRDLLDRHGIPAEWIDCQMMIVSSRTRGSGVYLRLVVKHWDERLMNYASAFQKALLADIRQFEPQAANWLHGISWQLEVEGSCPYTTLPGKNFWLETRPEAVPESVSETKSRPEPELPHQQTKSQAEPVNAAELERLFAIRDRELNAHADNGQGAAGYEKTQPAPL